MDAHRPELVFYDWEHGRDLTLLRSVRRPLRIAKTLCRGMRWCVLPLIKWIGIVRCWRGEPLGLCSNKSRLIPRWPSDTVTMSSLPGVGASRRLVWFSANRRLGRKRKPRVYYDMGSMCSTSLEIMDKFYKEVMRKQEYTFVVIAETGNKTRE
jgi:hypothetical protein